jgi:hypothetical protein
MVVDSNSGVLTWTPTEGQGPSTNVITVRVTDGGALSDTKSFTVVVNEASNPPLLSPIMDQIACAGVPLAVAVSATDTSVPPGILIFSLEPGAPAGAIIDPASGMFTWTPANNEGPATNVVTVRVSKNGLASLSDTKSFNIVIVAVPVIESIVASDGGVTISWSAITGKSYRLQFKSELKEPNWTDLSGDVLATGSKAAKTDTETSGAQRSYRVALLP